APQRTPPSRTPPPPPPTTNSPFPPNESGSPPSSAGSPPARPLIRSTTPSKPPPTNSSTRPASHSWGNDLAVRGFGGAWPPTLRFLCSFAVATQAFALAYPVGHASLGQADRSWSRRPQCALPCSMAHRRLVMPAPCSCRGCEDAARLGVVRRKIFLRAMRIIPSFPRFVRSRTARVENVG